MNFVSIFNLFKFGVIFLSTYRCKSFQSCQTCLIRIDQMLALASDLAIRISVSLLFS